MTAVEIKASGQPPLRGKCSGKQAGLKIIFPQLKTARTNAALTTRHPYKVLGLASAITALLPSNLPEPLGAFAYSLGLGSTDISQVARQNPYGYSIGGAISEPRTARLGPDPRIVRAKCPAHGHSDVRGPDNVTVMAEAFTQ